MKRRSFLRSSVAAAYAAAAASAPGAAAERPPSTLYELRAYSLKRARQPVLDAYLGQAFIPALKRLDLGPVGVFVEKGEQDPLKVWVLVVYPSAEAFVTLPDRLAADDEYRKAAGPYLDAPASDPVYSRIETSLLAPIPGMPRLERPDTSKPRLFNLRTYESHNERAARKKVEMFDKAELAIFRRVGLTPVFFGEAVAGPAMPNLTYMLVFADDAARQAAWGRFGADPEWQRLRSVPEYADKEIVSHITNRILTPAPYSEV
jgi:hypothetical protein